MDTVPRIRSAKPAVALPDDHLLVALAHIAASSRGLSKAHRRTLAAPAMRRYTPIIEKLHDDTRDLRSTPQGCDRADWLCGIALHDLATACTQADRLAGAMRPRMAARGYKLSDTAAS
ncbi:hypothetical protein CH263_25695 [Rhodococcus sp. 06-1059B-a]|nr:hypothetical protein CH263_25695 [Rhodococcus sp. 06-1059B-a]